MNPTWKRLLKRSLITTPVPVGARGYCSPWCIQRFIYQALSDAGIENRSPFSPLAVLRIWLQSRGKPAAVRSLCLAQLDAMTRPSHGFSHAYSLIAVVSTAVLLWALLSPQTADTNFAHTGDDSILKVVIHPMADIDATEVALPLAGDYREAPYSPGIRNTSGLAGSQWILQQPAERYTLQLLSASQLSGLEKFCQRHDICRQAAYYRTTLDGSPLYRLLYGQYPSNKAAQTALKQLPDELRAMSPWSRQFQQIRLEIQG